jgi:RNA polymerase sigma-70 factor, ECF subfamily
LKNITHRSVSDWEMHLIRQAAEGNQVAFELLMDLHRSSLEALSMRMLRNRDDASDAVQETSLKAFRGIRTFDPRRPIKPWLCRICANCCVDIVRTRKRGGESLDAHEYMLEDESASLENHAEDQFEEQAVRQAVRKLPKKYQEIVVMRHFRDMDVNEIAEALNKPEGTVKSWLFRARALLKAELQPLALG